MPPVCDSAPNLRATASSVEHGSSDQSLNAADARPPQKVMCGIPLSEKVLHTLEPEDVPTNFSGVGLGIQGEGSVNVTRNAITRRVLAKGGLVAVALAPIAGLFRNTVAYSESPALDPGEQTARSLNHVTRFVNHDAYYGNASQSRQRRRCHGSLRNLSGQNRRIRRIVQWLGKKAFYVSWLEKNQVMRQTQVAP
jgi:hypothetical protein